MWTHIFCYILISSFMLINIWAQWPKGPGAAPGHGPLVARDGPLGKYIDNYEISNPHMSTYIKIITPKNPNRRGSRLHGCDFLWVSAWLKRGSLCGLSMAQVELVICIDLYCFLLMFIDLYWFYVLLLFCCYWLYLVL